MIAPSPHSRSKNGVASLAYVGEGITDISAEFGWVRRN
jgi:hypothetical protein